jgi:flagellar biosynthesis/type III secretory pathway protein FliH
MKYCIFKRPDGMYTITDQNTGLSLKLATPNLELANRIAQELNEAYSQGYQLGFTEANGENESK